MLKQEQLQRDHELLKVADAPKWTSIDPLHRHWKKSLWPTMNYETRRSGQWIVDSGQWTVARNGERRQPPTQTFLVVRHAFLPHVIARRTRKNVCVGGQNGGKQTWKRVRGKEQEDLSPSLPNPAPSPFFLAHFSLRFPNYLKACYRLTTSFIYKFLWYIPYLFDVPPWVLIKFLDLKSGRFVRGGCLFEAGRLLTFLPLGWALIRGAR